MPTEDDTLLHVACRGNDVNMVKALLACPNIDINLKNDEGKIPRDCTRNEEVRNLFLTPQEKEQKQRNLLKDVIQRQPRDVEIPLTEYKTLNVNNFSFLTICSVIGKSTDETLQEIRNVIDWDQLLEKNHLFQVLEDMLNDISVSDAVNKLKKCSPKIAALTMVQIMLVSSACGWRPLVSLAFAYLQSHLNKHSVVNALKGYLLFIHKNQQSIGDKQQRDQELIDALLIDRVAKHMQSVISDIPDCFNGDFSDLLLEAFMFISKWKSKPSLKQVLAKKDNKREFNAPKPVSEYVERYVNQYIESGAFKSNSTNTSTSSLSLPLSSHTDVVVGTESEETPIFYIHSFVLKSVSDPLFNLCCGTNFKEASQDVKRLSTSTQVLECIIRWMYTRKPISSMNQSGFDADPGMMFELVNICEPFFIHDLRDAAVDELKRMVKQKPDDAVRLVMIMKQENMWTTNNKTMNDLKEYTKSVVNTISIQEKTRLFEQMRFE